MHTTCPKPSLQGLHYPGHVGCSTPYNDLLKLSNIKKVFYFSKLKGSGNLYMFDYSLGKNSDLQLMFKLTLLKKDGLWGH